MRKILIAGASGFIGRSLIERLLKNPEIEIVALSRRSRESQSDRVRWEKCDLFSLKDISDAMLGCDEAYYLVHSMLPSAGLSQGTFYDFDLIMADNFIRAGKIHELKHIIYLGGMIPVGEELSWHLKSRLEVEETLRNSMIPTTVLRAGLIIGPEGSSFTILQRLIERLPVMICPKWTNTRSCPVFLEDVINVLVRVVGEKSLQNKIYDIAGPEVTTYQGLMQKAARKIRRKTKLLTLNVIPLSISRFWVSLITGVPRDLVYPLVLSLRHEMLPNPKLSWPHPEDLQTPLDDALTRSLVEEYQFRKTNYSVDRGDVRSIQRLVLPAGKNADWVAREYFHWLPFFFSSLVKVTLSGERCTFHLFHSSLKILILEKSSERSTPDRQLLYVVGGILAGKMERGRLEFREVLNHQYVMAALHEFRPALPWFIYRWTQALVHVVVMRAFGEHLKWIFLAEKKGAH